MLYNCFIFDFIGTWLRYIAPCRPKNHNEKNLMIGLFIFKKKGLSNDDYRVAMLSKLYNIALRIYNLSLKAKRRFLKV